MWPGNVSDVLVSCFIMELQTTVQELREKLRIDILEMIFLLHVVMFCFFLGVTSEQTSTIATEDADDLE